MENNATQAECCPEFNPLPWDNKFFDWDNKKFIKDKVCTFFYIPLNFGKVMKRLSHKVEKNSAEEPDWLCLSDHTSKWNMDIYLAVNKEVPETENATLTGKFFSKVYEGDFKNTEKWMKDFKSYAVQNKLNIQKWYMWYTTCPKCAKKYGKNYVVIIGKLD
jgi:hypothetical protein